MLLAVVALPVPFAFLTGLLLRGAARWVLVGAVGISGLWLAVLLVVVVSGAGPSLMGVQAEEWTAQELRRLRRYGWHSIDGVMLRSKSDIDHVAVGPGGVLVIESKWSGEDWLGDHGSWYSKLALSKAMDQARENSHLVWLTFARGIPEEYVMAVCVLWSNQTRTEERARESGGVTIVPASRLHDWLREVDTAVIDSAQIEQIVTAIKAHVERRDAGDAKRGVVHQPPLRSILIRSVLSPMLGALAALYASLFINRSSGHWQLALPSIVGLAIIGILAQRIRRVRQVALGWTLGAAFSGMVLLIIVVRAYL